MNLYNHISKNIERVDDATINAYFCGPTVHAFSHIGHARTFSIFDSMRKYFTSKGKIVNFGMNITDIDDKINWKVRKYHYMNLLGEIDDNLKIEDLETIMLEKVKEGKFKESDMTPSIDLYYKFIEEKSQLFWSEMESIGISKPTIVLRVSEVMDKIEDMIAKLIEKGCAYESNGSVYFNVRYYHEKFNMCPLSNSTDEDINLKDGHNSEKINAQDFALWKKAKPYSISFPSRWGNGTPGWHIECSVMSSIMFGDTVHLHGGGIDLKYPHHHNEVLQSNSYFDKDDVFKHFTYVGHVCVRNSKTNSVERMAQSIGNYIRLNDYLKDHSSNSMRLLAWLSYWANPMELNNGVIEQATSLENRINEFLSNIEYYIKKNKNNTINDDVIIKLVYDLFNRIDFELENEFKTNEVIRIFNEIMTEVTKVLKSNSVGIDNVIMNFITQKTKNLLNIIGFSVTENNDVGDEKFIAELGALRDTLRSKKQYELSDYVRDVVFPRLGYSVQDVGKDFKVKKIDN